MNALTRFLVLPLLPLCALSASVSAATLSPSPEPSGEEQYLLERINTARANPAAEGQMLAGSSDSEIARYYSYYGVDRNKLRSDFASYAAKPPLAMNAKLMASARQQSLDQAANGFQGHDSSNGTHFDQRITAQGYGWSALGENVFAYVENPFFGHVGLNADWGVPSLDHRANIMNDDASFPTFKEVGISYVSTSVPNFGPYVLTQDFGTPASSSAAFLVGVVYNDADGSGSYDVGEGLGGVTIMTDKGDFFTTSGVAGGYVLPLPAGSGTLTITAQGGALGAARVTTVNYTSGTNVKVDFTTAQSAGPALPVVQLSASTKNLTAGGQPSVLKIARSGNLSQDLQVALGVSGSAIPGVDFTALPSNVTIPAGQNSIALPLQASLSPAVTAATKKIKIKLQNGAGYLVSSDAHLAKAAVKIWAQN